MFSVGMNGNGDPPCTSREINKQRRSSNTTGRRNLSRSFTKVLHRHGLEPEAEMLLTREDEGKAYKGGVGVRAGGVECVG